MYIYVKPMNSMVLDNKQYNTYSTIRVQNRLSLILLGYNKTIACNTRTFAWRTRSHTYRACTDLEGVGVQTLLAKLKCL